MLLDAYILFIATNDFLKSIPNTHIGNFFMKILELSVTSRMTDCTNNYICTMEICSQGQCDSSVMGDNCYKSPQWKIK